LFEESFPSEVTVLVPLLLVLLVPINPPVLSV
jgi:hypothetical protein